jgi:crossover junction endodeoxyribonuclease RuvC
MANAGGILALDLATVVGWAYGMPGGRPIHGSHRFAPVGSSRPEFFRLYGLWLSDMITVHDPRAIVFEAPVLNHKGPKKTSIETARKLIGLAAVTECIAATREVRKIQEVGAGTVKKHWTGNGHAKKPDMLDVARRMGFEPRDDNAADALGVWHWAVAQLAPRVRQPRYDGPLLGVGRQ